jgi:hypothetical protein
VNYLSDRLEVREPQTIYMAAGSAFDALVKAQITNDLQTATRFDARQLFEEQVDPQFREELWPKAEYWLHLYKECGAYGIAVADMGLANLEPRFEFGVDATILGVPCYGKPDAFYINQHGTPVILDWKVNSIFSSVNAKRKHYVTDHQTGAPAKGVVIVNDSGLPVCVNKGLEDVDESWAFQQFVYAIGLGSSIGDQFITSIDQVTNGPSFYTYRAHLSKKFQIECAVGLKEMWEDINSGYVFRQMGKTREESDQMIANLEGPLRDVYF